MSIKQKQLQNLSGDVSGSGDELIISDLSGIGGVVDCHNNRLINIAIPTSSTDCVNKSYVDTALAGTSNILSDILSHGNTTEANSIVVSNGGSILFDANNVAPLIRATTTTLAGHNFTIEGQSSATSFGGGISITSGTGTDSGSISIGSSAATGTTGNITIQSGNGDISGNILISVGTGATTDGSITLSTNGDIGINGGKLGFFSETPVVRPTITGTNYITLTNLLTGLDNLGLINNTAVISQPSLTTTDGYTLLASIAKELGNLGIVSPPTIAFTSFSSVIGHDTTNTPITLYQFQSNLLDSSGNGWDLSAAVGTATYHKYYNLRGFWFDGYAQLTSSAAIPGLVGSGDLTISYIGNLDVREPGNRVIVGYGTTTLTGGGTEAKNTQFAININDGYINVNWEYGAGSSDSINFNFYKIISPGLHHYTFVRSDTGLTWSIYIDGRLVDSKPALNAPTGGADTDSRLVLGYVPSIGILGYMASLKITGSALNAAQILTEYERCFGPLHGYN